MSLHQHVQNYLNSEKRGYINDLRINPNISLQSEIYAVSLSSATTLPLSGLGVGLL